LKKNFAAKIIFFQVKMKICGDPPLANYHKFSFLSKKNIIFAAKIFFKLFANEPQNLQNFR